MTHYPVQKSSSEPVEPYLLIPYKDNRPFLESVSARQPSDSRTQRDIDRERRKARDDYIYDCCVKSITSTSESKGFPSVAECLDLALISRDICVPFSYKALVKGIFGQTFISRDYMWSHGVIPVVGMSYRDFFGHFTLLNSEYMITEEFDKSTENQIMNNIIDLLAQRTPRVVSDLMAIVERHTDSLWGRFTIEEMALRHVWYMYDKGRTINADELDKFLKTVLRKDIDGHLVCWPDSVAKLIRHDIKYGRIMAELDDYYNEHILKPLS